MPNEQTEFLKSLDAPETVDIMDQPIEPEGTTPTVKVEADPEEVPEEVKNRRHKRLEEKLRAEREANIAMAARLETIAESQRARADDEPADYVKHVERIYGTNSPEAQEATSLLQTALKSVEDRATTRALETFRKEQAEAIAQTRKEESRLDVMAEQIEDEFSVDLTSPKAAAAREGFFKMLARVSPKDAQGNITDYADHIAVWEDYQAKTKKPESRAKALSSRSMTASGSSSGGQKPVDDATARYLSDNGFI